LIVNAQQSQTLEVTTPSDREVVITRTFNAGRARVFSAFTEPELIKRWFGLAGWSMSSCEVDLRPGGKFHYHWTNDENGAGYGLIGTYREIEAPARIVYREDHDEAGNPGDATVTTTFVERNGVTAMTMTMLFDSRELRDNAIESGQIEGWGVCFDHVANVVRDA
jgi:uncharacterized protein YndB with AHSA1/START domain